MVMEKNSSGKLSNLSPSLKVLVSCFVLTLLLAYSVALFRIFDHSRFDWEETVRYYRGAESGEEQEIYPPATFATLLSVSHVHTFSQPVMLGLMGFLFCLSRATEKWKAGFVLFSFTGSVVSNAAPWLIRYVSAPMVHLLPLSQFAMLGSFLVMSWTVLREVWTKKATRLVT